MIFFDTRTVHGYRAAMIKRLYDWTMEKFAHRHAERWLFMCSFM
jgi:hypothetical protein